MVGKVYRKPVEPVRDRRAGRTPPRVVGSEHEVVNEELRASSEEVCQRGAPFFGVEPVLLFHPDPRQILPQPRQLVAAPRQLLFRFEQIEPSRQPLPASSGLMSGHILPPTARRVVVSRAAIRRSRAAPSPFPARS